MGNPEAAGSSAHQQAQEYELQPQEYQYENTAAPTYEQQEAQPPLPANQGYRAQTPGPAIVPHTMQQNNQTFPNGPNQPVAAYPPQGPQTIPAHPVKFPPPGPQAAVPFPPPSQQRSPVHPQVTVQTTPMMYPQATAQMPPTVGYQAPPVMQYQNNNGPQAQYGIPVPSPGPKSIQENAWSSGLFDCMNDPMNGDSLLPCSEFNT